MSTQGRDYAERLRGMQTAWYRKPFQTPYRLTLQAQQLGRTIDVGCGIGRQLGWLDAGSIGVDHNEHSVAVARELGHAAYTVAEFLAGPLAQPATFDAMLLAHVVEHMQRDEALELVRSYLPYVRPGGRVMFICPQEVGYRSDATHVRFYDGEDLVLLARDLGLEPGQWWSFPFPRALGKVFIYNEFNLVATVPTMGESG